MGTYYYKNHSYSEGLLADDLPKVTHHVPRARGESYVKSPFYGWWKITRKLLGEITLFKW